MLLETHGNGIPMALINARISDRSARNWKRAARSARHLLGCFSFIHCQDARTTQHLHDLGITAAFTGQNLKSAAGPLPFDKTEAALFRNTISRRPIWLASSTHPGEEEIVLTAHRALLKDYPDLLLLLVPRHPERAGDIAHMISAQGLTHSRRSAGEKPSTDTQVYLADTLGETGLWYKLSPITCLCGSFTPVGGHNPYEPAYAGSAVLHGPQYANFAQVYADFDSTGGAVEVADADALAQTVDRLLGDRTALKQMRNQASSYAVAQSEMLEALSGTLCTALNLR